MLHVDAQRMATDKGGEWRTSIVFGAEVRPDAGTYAIADAGGHRRQSGQPC